MDLRVCQNEVDWVNAVDKVLVEKCSEYGAKRVFLPAGETPRPLYGKWRSVGRSLPDSVELLQIDDVITGPKKGIFQRFFRDELGASCKSFHPFSEGGERADVAVLGLGMNGHVAFHEPDLPVDFYSGCVRLSPVTCSNLGVERGTWGATYGLGAFMACKAILLIVRGEKKADVLARSLRGDARLPSGQLIRHPDLTVITDFQVTRN